MKYLLITVIFILKSINCYKNLDLDILPALHSPENRDALKEFFNKFNKQYVDPRLEEYKYDDDNDGDDGGGGYILANDLNLKSRNYDKLNYRDINFNDLLQNDFSKYNSYSDDDSDVDAMENDPRDQESESHGSLVGGYQFVSGGAGEGKQHLQPNGQIPNKEEIKSDIDLPAYCDPPNPCPIGYKGDDCDRKPYNKFTAEYSRLYQNSQNCMCDTDHNECKRDSIMSDMKLNNIFDTMKQNDEFPSIVAKKSPRIRRGAASNENENKQERLLFHVAKKSPII